MNRPRLLLAIETSCDETSAAVVAEDFSVRSLLVRSQHAAHARYRGVVPEIAAREHLAALPPIVRTALAEAGSTPADLAAVAATAGPGLVGALLVGVAFAKSFAYATRRPFVRVNHILGHLHAIRLLDPDVEPPFLALVVSGGHTELVRVGGWAEGDAVVLGRTRDDAAGEAFDKVAAMLGFGFPGGAALAERALRAKDPGAFDLPVPMAKTTGLDFSFSGIKTSVRYLLRDREREGRPLADAERDDLAAAFEQAMAEALAERVSHALDMARAAGDRAARTFLLTGGVAANRTLAARIRSVAEERGARFLVPNAELSTDNAAMIAAAAWARVAEGSFDGLDAGADPAWELTEAAQPLGEAAQPLGGTAP